MLRVLSDATARMRQMAGRAVARPGDADHHITYHRVLEALAGERCPVCLLVADGVASRLGALFHELVNDPECRQRLRTSLGFCRRHTDEALRRGNALGVAIVYRDLVRSATARVEAAAAGRRPARLCECPECAGEVKDTSAYTGSLAEYLADDEMRSAYIVGHGLCVLHMEAVLALAPLPAKAFLAEQEGERLMALWRELEEFIRKSDWRFCNEGYGPESDSPSRATAKLAGDAPWHEGV